MEIKIQVNGKTVIANRMTTTVNRRYDPTQLINWRSDRFDLTECMGIITGKIDDMIVNHNDDSDNGQWLTGFADNIFETLEGVVELSNYLD